MKYTLLSLLMGLLILGFTTSFRPEKAGGETGIRWLTIAQLKDSMRINPKRVFIKIYTDWCGPCKLMDKKTLSKERIIEPLNRYYYSIALNAEDTNAVQFKDSVFHFNPNLGRGIHNLALHLGRDAGTLAYPTIVILDENLEVIYKYPSFMSVLNLEEVLFLYKDISK